VKNKRLFTLCALGLALLNSFAGAYAQNSDQGNGKLGPYKQLTTISIPGGLPGFDISWVDSKSGRYYLANRGSATATPPVSPSISVIDTERDEFLYAIPLSNAPNGVVAIHRTGNGVGEPGPGTLVVGTTPKPSETSEVVFIDLGHPFAPPLTVSTGGNHRADELAYDTRDHIILIANDQDVPAPFVTFISTENSPHVIGKIVYDGTLGNPKSTGGIEQPVWDKRTKRFYLAIPSTAANAKGEVDEINPATMKITRVFPTTCSPAGLALIPAQHLMTSCGDVLDIATGAVVHTVPGLPVVDEIWYNSGDERVYFGGLFSVPVVSGVSPYDVIGSLPWAGHFTPPPPQFSHSIAADSENNHIFLPVSNVGVLVFTDDRDNGEGSDKP
jgi:hypothetical protein